uniref:Uncharacterized protein n=1 Tax=Sphaerodactylus townsendi TaxID=933632 RepID=A0ACB8G0I2_9SAUR
MFSRTSKTAETKPTIHILLVIRAKVKEVKAKCHDITAIVEVKEILKSSLVNIPRDTVNLYTNSGCLCPPLNANEEYIIMGYEDEERSRLLLVEGSIAEKWKDRLGKKVKENLLYLLRKMPTTNLFDYH